MSSFNLPGVANRDNFDVTTDFEKLSLSQTPLLPLQHPAQLDSDSPGPARYGSLCSHYNTLDTSTISKLEEAILYCRVRAFKESLAIFDAFPTDLKHHPVIAYEHSLAHWSRWTLWDCARVLREALAWAEENRADVNSTGIYTLLRLALGKAEVFTKGDFTRARDSMRDIKRWLGKLPIEDYIDLQVRQCSLILQFSSRFRNATHHKHSHSTILHFSDSIVLSSPVF